MTRFSFATASRTVLSLDRAQVFFDGTFSEPRLAHPECVAIGPGGYVWCGTETGDIVRIAPDGSAIERMATVRGFILGLAFDGVDTLYACEQRTAAVFRLDIPTGRLERFSQPGIRLPNYPLVHRTSGRLFVSDSFGSGETGPGVWAFDLETGEGQLWYDRPMHFANGLAMRPGENALYVCETFGPGIVRIPIGPDGRAGAAERFVWDLPGLPDGIAFDDSGRLIVACYEPSRLLRVSADGACIEVLIEDPTAHIFCHPTNVAFDGSLLYAANLGRWHITRIDLDRGAPALWDIAH